MKSKTSCKGRKRKSSASTLKLPPVESLQKKDKSSTSRKKQSSLGLDDDILEVGDINNTSDRRTRNKQTCVKYEREDIKVGWRGCPECGAMELWQDACKTVTCRKSHLHHSTKTKGYVRWCIFCKKRCEGVELTVKCDCPGYNGSEERRLCHEQYQLPVNMLNDDEDEAEEGRSRLVSDEGGTTSDEPPSSSQSSSQDDDGSDESYVMSGGSSDEEEDSGDTTSSESASLQPDEVKSNHTLTSALVPDTVNSNPVVKEEEESTDEEGYGEMGTQARKKRVKVESQVFKTEEVSTDDEDEGMAADDKSSSPAVADRLKVKQEKGMEVEAGSTKPALEKKYLDLPGGFVYGRMCTVENCPKDDCLALHSDDAEDSDDDVVVVEKEKEAVPSSNRRSSQLPVSAKAQSNIKSQSAKKKRKAPPREVEEGNGSVQKAAHKTCSIEGCIGNALDSGKCKKHNGYKYCKQEGCTKKARKGGVCTSHGAVVKKKTCDHEGCTNKRVQGGVCIRHGAKVKTCKHEGCTNQIQNGGVCVKHGAKVQTCSHEGCTNNVQNGGVCLRHGAILKTCSHEGCTNYVQNGVVCYSHREFAKG